MVRRSGTNREPEWSHHRLPEYFGTGEARKSLEEVALLVPKMQAAALRITKILSVIDEDEVEEEAEIKPGRRKRS